MPRPRIYLAGPEVFLPDAIAMGARKAAMCAAHGLEGAFPLDAQLDLAGLPKAEAARRISQANEGLMRSCAGLIANLDKGAIFKVVAEGRDAEEAVHALEELMRRMEKM